MPSGEPRPVASPREREEVGASSGPGARAAQAILEEISDAVVAIDLAGKVSYWGPGAAALYGVAAADALGKLLTDLYTYRWDSPDEERRAFATLEREGRWRGRNVHVLRSGAERFVESTVSVLRGEAGERVGLLAVIRDETERVLAERARRRAEQALGASEALYGALFRGLMETVFIYEPVLDARGELADVVVRDANEAAIAQAGLAREALVGRRATELFGEEAMRPFLAHLGEVLRTGVPARWESSFAWDERQYLAGAHAAGGVIFAVGLDVTDRRRAEEALRESEQRFRAAFANAAIGFAMTTPAGRFVDVNPAFCALTGYSAEELTQLTFSALVHPEDRAENEALNGRMAAAEHPGFVVENRYVRKTGEPVWVRKSVSAIRDAAGTHRWSVALVEDVGYRRRAEQALRESEERARLRAAELEAVLDAVPAAVWISRDPRGDRIDANRFGAELLRRPPGANVSVTAPGDDRPRNFVVQRGGIPIPPDELPLQRAARFGEEIRDAETEVLFEGGEVRRLLGNAVPLRDADGRPKGSVGAFIDVTERRRAEEELRDADRRKTEFLALLSHELRNPLAPIRNSLVLLERSPPDGPVARRAREVLQRQTRQLERLVDDLLDISRIAHGKIALQLEPLDAREVVRRAYADAKAQFDERDVELVLSEPSEPLWVQADAARLSQMLGNLLHNALKFTPPRGLVRVKVARRGGACEVSVRDTGVGLEPSQLERIFEPFVQAERPPGAPGVPGGLGLGLALVRDLAAKHGGTVRAASDGPGAGAEFVLQLPLAQPPEAAGEDAQGAAAPAGLAVLVVDDNEDGGLSLCDLLALDGHRATLATTGAAGIEAAARGADVLLCDIGLPDMSGHEVIRRIRAGAGGDAPFAIALTGYAQPSDRDAALAAGFDAHLPKPPPLDALQGLLQEAARRREARGAAV